MCFIFIDKHVPLSNSFSLLHSSIIIIMRILKREVESVESEAGLCSLCTCLKTLGFLLACQRHRFLHAFRSTNQYSNIRSTAFILELAEYFFKVRPSPKMYFVSFKCIPSFS